MSDAPKPSPLAAPEPWNLVADDYTLELLPMFELFSRDALAPLSSRSVSNTG
jgi:hypothetical protein